MAGEHALPVAVETPQHSGVGGLLTYLSERPLAPGTMVDVPLGRRQVPGIVWHGSAMPAEGVLLKPITRVLETLSPLPGPWRSLVEFAAGYYQRGVGELALAVLPPELRRLDDAQMQRRLVRWAREAARASGLVAVPPPALPELGAEQAEALARLRSAGPVTTLVHGVTGSGKTEVYLRAVADALEQGGQALVLVPEINLTPQLEARFSERFPGRVLVSQHSRLTPAQRLRHWVQSHTGQADVVLGTRLAVFASMPRLAIVVVDEEHDASFKQQEGARYSARDLAVYRGHLEGVPVLLGSATPSLESWARAGEGRYGLVRLPARVSGGSMPRVRLVDMNALPRSRREPIVLAPALLQAVEERVQRGEQTLMLLNRRGYAPVLHCAACGWKSGCAHCSAWRVFHKVDRTLRCHHCGLADPVPRACPDCGNLDIAPLGRGTEKLEEQLALLLPAARVARIDADSTRLQGALEEQLAAVHAGEVDVLVGTQMVTKGHDFRRITLVVALNPDAALFASDFRAPERLFALLMQAAGRAGRDAEQSARSEMWVQTGHPRHPLYAALREHRFEGFAATQLEERRASGLPPYASLALLRADAAQAEMAQAFLAEATLLAAELPESAPVTLYPPVPHPVARVADVDRVQMLLESASRPGLQRFLATWLPALHGLRKRHPRVKRWAVDVDPLSI